MAATCTVTALMELTGLGKDSFFSEKGTVQTTPDAATYNYRTIATANTAEALDLGDVSTELLVVIKAVTYDLDVDCDYVDAFNADITVKASGPPAVIPNPAGSVYVKNNGTDEAAVYEYWCIGTT